MDIDPETLNPKCICGWMLESASLFRRALQR